MVEFMNARIARALVVVPALWLAVPTASFAASCLQAPAKMSDTAMKGFMDNPSGLLSGNGAALSDAVYNIAASNSDALSALLELSKTATDAQNAAIGAGLARAVKACANVDPAYADNIQQQIAALDNTALQVAYQTASSQVQTASLGGGFGAGGAVGGGTTGNGNSQRGGPNGFRPGLTRASAVSGFTFASGTHGRSVSPTR